MPVIRSSGTAAAGDFNADEHLDLAFTEAGSFSRPGALFILLGNGDGTFRSPPPFLMGPGSFPRLATVGDFDGDARQDLAVVISGGLAIFLGNGDGTFRHAAGTGIRYSGAIVVGDFNGDKVQDLAVASYDSNSVAVALGNGDGTFQAPQNFAVGMAPSSIAIGDFNGDDLPDLAVANYDSNNVSILLNDARPRAGALEEIPPKLEEVPSKMIDTRPTLQSYQ